MNLSRLDESFRLMGHSSTFLKIHQKVQPFLTTYFAVTAVAQKCSSWFLAILGSQTCSLRWARFPAWKQLEHLSDQLISTEKPKKGWNFQILRLSRNSSWASYIRLSISHFMILASFILKNHFFEIHFGYG